ncbi:MAG TPA: hypothetical protein VNT20_17230 [Flavisolibacter sp.]|jgi:hypothetical protein|nr:hypothetical protein [Flavisolibacter sp.]
MKKKGSKILGQKPATVVRIFLTSLVMLTSIIAAAQPKKLAATTVKKIPIIDITDLYHPYQDPGDNFDLIMAYALPEFDLRAIILDITDAFRKPVADHPTLWKDPRGPREAGFIPVLQLNYIFNRNIPFAVGPMDLMKSETDAMRDLPGFQEAGVELFLNTLQASTEKIDVLSFGSARLLAVAYNRDPELLKRKINRIHLSAGTASPDFSLGTDAGANAIPGGEWNVALDTYAFRRVLKSGLPIVIYPCASKDGGFVPGNYTTYWKMPGLNWIKKMNPQLRRYLDFSFSKAQRTDFLRAMDIDEATAADTSFYPSPHHVWETAIWMNCANRVLVKSADGTCKLIPKFSVDKSAKIIKESLVPCTVTVRDDGRFSFMATSKPTNFKIYYRENVEQNEAGYRTALPELYLSFLTKNNSDK